MGGFTKEKILFWAVLVIIVFVCFILPTFAITNLAFGEITTDEAGKVWINKGQDVEKLQRETLQKIYEEINIKLNTMVTKYRARRGYRDIQDKINKDLQHIQVYMSRYNPLPKDISIPASIEILKIIIEPVVEPLPIEPIVEPIIIPMPDPIIIPPDNGNNGNGLGGGLGNGGNNNGIGNNGIDNGIGTGNNNDKENNGNHNGQKK